MSDFRIIEGNALAVLRTLPEASVNACVTSPPYYGLRAYGTEPQVWGGRPECEHEWGDEQFRRGPAGNQGRTSQMHGRALYKEGHNRPRGRSEGCWCQLCGAWRGELGLEPTPELYVEHIVAIFREVRRVLRADGTLWLNLGDCFATGAGKVGECPGGGEQGERWKERGAQTQPNRLPLPGLKPKDLIGIPWMVAFALRADGWWLRMDNIWAKRNCLPESVKDRTTKSHEYVFLLSKSESYYYDSDAIAEPLTTDERENYPARTRITGRGDQAFAAARGGDRGKSGGFPPLKRSGNTERVLEVPTKPNNHRGTSIPWEGSARNKRSVWWIKTQPFPEAHFAVMPEELAEVGVLAGCPEGGAVLDPFAGSGTVGAVALRHGRNFIGIDLNPEYVHMAERRVDSAMPLIRGTDAVIEIGPEQPSLLGGAA